MVVCRLQMALSYVVVGQLVNWYGAIWAICMWGVGSGFVLVYSSFARAHAFSFMVIHVRA